MLRFAAFEVNILELEAQIFKPSTRAVLLQHSVALSNDAHVYGELQADEFLSATWAGRWRST